MDKVQFIVRRVQNEFTKNQYTKVETEEHNSIADSKFSSLKQKFVIFMQNIFK
jgi:hypothetical protein